MPGPDDMKRYNPDDLEPYLLDIAAQEEHEVSFEGNGHVAEDAAALLRLLKGRLSSRIIRAIEGGLRSSNPRRERTAPLPALTPPYAPR